MFLLAVPNIDAILNDCQIVNIEKAIMKIIIINNLMSNFPGSFFLLFLLPILFTFILLAFLYIFTLLNIKYIIMITYKKYKINTNKIKIK